MNLGLVHKIINDINSNKYAQNFIQELQKYLENNTKREELALLNPTHNGNKIITKYRDKMLLERADILNNYASKTIDEGEMYYIYSKNSKMEDGYNICNCEKEKSHIVIEVDKEVLPSEAKIGSVLRKNGDTFIIDEKASTEIDEQINNMKTKILEEQAKYLASKRIEGHIYEMSENDGNSAWLFDITTDSNEGVEEIDFPLELLQRSKEGDLFIYENGEYHIYLK